MGFRSKQLTLLTTISLSHKLGCKRQNGKSKNIPNYTGQEEVYFVNIAQVTISVRKP